MDLLLNIFNIQSYFDFLYLISFDNLQLAFNQPIVIIQLLYCTLKKYKEQYFNSNELNLFLYNTFIETNIKVNNNDISNFINIILNSNIELNKIMEYLNSHNNFNDINKLIK